MSMKVGGIGSVRSSVTRRTKGKSGGGFEIAASAHSHSVASATSSGATTPVGALLAVQEVADASEGNRRGLVRGKDLLQELEQIHLGLLMGAVPRIRIERLMRLLKERRGGYADPRLDNIVAEIEVRAAVELAKFERTSIGSH